MTQAKKATPNTAKESKVEKKKSTSKSKVNELENQIEQEK